jgi:hypothetical protein
MSGSGDVESASLLTNKRKRTLLVVDECLRQVQRRRQDVLDRARRARRSSGSLDAGERPEGVSTRGTAEQHKVLKRIIDEELEKNMAEMETDRRRSCHSCHSGGCGAGAGVAGVNFCTLSTAGGPGSGSCRTGQTAGTGPRDRSESLLTDEEYMDLILRMEQELYNDMQEEELDYLIEMENADIDAMMEAHFEDRERAWPDGRDPGSHAALSPGRAGACTHSSSYSSVPTVPCPVCRQRQLLTRDGSIYRFYCPEGHLTMDTSFEGIGLDQLDRMVRECETRHSQTRCPGAVRFEQRAGSDPSTNSLVGGCHLCGWCDVVL